ncbi:MAG: MarR family transcriptional regulator [Alphaproteobacteria bacterium]|nr:MarR family transcriptional regulator [Alphaproteobacteria bacterium]
MLLDQGAMTVTELAAALGMTHAGAIKASRQLIDAGLVERMADPGDRRRKPLGLTREGRKSAAEARRFIELARHAYVALFEEIGVDLYSAIQAMNAALDRQGFDQRLAEAAAQIARTTPQA